MPPNHTAAILKGLTGFCANALGIITSMQEHLEWTLRCASLVVGISVGILTGWSIVKGWKRGK